MIQGTRFTQLVQLLGRGSARNYLVGGTICIILLLVGGFFLQFALYRIEVGDSMVTKQVYLDDKPQSFHTILGISLVPRQANLLVVSHDQSLTQTTRYALYDKPIFDVKTIQAHTKPQHDVDKIGSEALGCQATTSTANYTYSCTNPTAFIQFRADDRWQNQPIYYLEDSSVMVEPYPDGIIALLSLPQEGEDNNRLAVRTVPLDTPAKEQQFKLKDMPTHKADDPMTLIKNATADHRVAILDNSRGKIYLYDNPSASPSAQFELRHKAADDEATYCTLTATNIVCYTGPSSESEVEPSRDSGYLEVFDIDAKSSQSYSVPSSIKTDVLCVTNDAAIYALTETQLFRLTPKGSGLATHQLATDVQQVSCGSHLYYTTNDAVFLQADEHRAEVVFSSTRHTISNLSSIGDSLTFNTFVANRSESVSEAYRLGINSASTPRFEDYLPYTNSDLPIVRMDYSSSNIFVQLSVPLISDRQTGQTIAEASDIQNAQQAVIARLQKDGLPTSSIIFVY